MDVKNFTYNEISFMAFGEAITAKHQIDALVEENERLATELAELKVERSDET